MASRGTNPSESGTENSKLDEPPSKRRRVALACNACRTRKSRCNGERPKCSLCRNLGFDCQYEPTESSTNVIVKKEYVSDFESRVKALEDKLKQHDHLLLSHLSACSKKPEITREALDNVASSRDSIHLDASELQEFVAEETVTDGMAMSFADELGSAFFGPSSNNAFTRHILGAMASGNITQPQTLTIHSNSGILDFSRPPSPSSPDAPLHSSPTIFELPPISEMEKLIATYFVNTGILFPYIHEPTFMETYYAFKASNFTKVRRAWLGLLNMVLAMGLSLDPSSKMSARTRSEKSQNCYERAVRLCGMASVRGASLDLVQYLLLASQYLQGTQKSSQTWTLHGLAVKGAFALGLHSAQASQRFSALENEVRKRTWYGCVLLDRVLSMTFGRPPCIPEEFIRLPLAEPWPENKGLGVLNDELQQPAMEFFNASITLHRLIGVAISRLYGQNLGCDPSPQEAEIMTRVFQLEKDSSSWQASLPSELPIIRSTNIPTPVSYRERHIARFRTMLTLRYHNLYILVHRPLLCKALDSLTDKSDAPWSTSIIHMTTGAIGACLASAEETIDIVHWILNNQSLGASILGAWWFTLFYTFNACLVVFANYLVRRSTSQQDGNRRLVDRDIDHLSRAITALRLLDSENRIVERCTEYVQYLLRIVEVWNQQNSDPLPHGTNVPTQPGDMNGLSMHQAHDFSIGDSLPDLNDFLKDDLELAQFFASGIFDMQSSAANIL